jgi:hypothetical protein
MLAVQQQHTAGVVAVAAPPPSAAAASLDGFFWVHDPAKTRGPKRVAAAVVEAARKSFGTDEDVLLIDVARGLRRSPCPCLSWCRSVTTHNRTSCQGAPHGSDGSCSGSSHGSSHSFMPLTATAGTAAGSCR